MKRHLFALAVLVAATAPATILHAADGANQPPSDAEKQGGIAGDPRGAISALGGKIHDDFKPGGNTVDVPKLGGDVGANHTGGAPPGISSGR